MEHSEAMKFLSDLLIRRGQNHHRRHGHHHSIGMESMESRLSLSSAMVSVMPRVSPPALHAAPTLQAEIAYQPNHQQVYSPVVGRQPGPNHDSN